MACRLLSGISAVEIAWPVAATTITPARTAQRRHVKPRVEALAARSRAAKGAGWRSEGMGLRGPRTVCSWQAGGSAAPVGSGARRCWPSSNGCPARGEIDEARRG